MGQVLDGNCCAQNVSGVVVSRQCASGAKRCMDTLDDPESLLLEDQAQCCARVNQLLLSAARDGDHCAVEVAICSNACLETRQPYCILRADLHDIAKNTDQLPGLTPLMYAAKGGYTQCVELLVDAGADVDAKEEDGMRPLHFAAQARCERCARILVVAGADVDVQDIDGKSVTDYLAEEGNHVTSEELGAWRELLDVVKPRPVQVRVERNVSGSLQIPEHGRNQFAGWQKRLAVAEKASKRANGREAGRRASAGLAEAAR